MPRDLTIVDLFCGTGGFSAGFLRASERFKLVYAVDLDPAATATARRNHASSRIDQADVRATRAAAIQRSIGISDIDVLIGGPPCQGFSSLRPNRGGGAEDDRNNLYMEFAQYAKVFRPKIVVMENVVGLLTHNQGNTLEQILQRFDNLGYRVDWRVLNAASYGVPQKRERFIMIASRGGGRLEFPAATHHFKGKVIGFRDKTRQVVGHEGLPPAISVMDAIGDLPPLRSGEDATTYCQPPLNGYQRLCRRRCRSLTLHKASRHSEKMMKVIRLAGSSASALPRNLVTSGFSTCYSRLASDEPANTITVKFQSPASSRCIHPDQDRTITPREAARLQSFEDAYRFEGSLTQIACQIGNAVPPLLGTAIARSVLECIR
jgi:DNA (cytosine-5)-methyltransferase 1